MNSSYGSFDFTGGWQDECTGQHVHGLYTAPSDFNSAQQPWAATPGDENPTTASPYWAPPATYTNCYYNNWGTGPPLSTSLPEYNAFGLNYWNDGTSYNNLPDCELPSSSFSESEMDYFHYFEGQAQSLPPAPIYAPFSIKPEPFMPSMIANPIFTNETTHIVTPPSNAPALFQCTQHMPTSPPLNDYEQNDPLQPRSQSLRFDADLYTPTFVRGAGSTRSGWCGYCATWHTLKDSAYWYHMHFAHGISCATGSRLPNPLRFRNTMGAARGVGDWDANCGGCGRWVLVVEGEKGRTAWFRHAYKCQLKGGIGPGGLGKQRSRVSRGKSRSPRKVAVRPAL